MGDSRPAILVTGATGFIGAVLCERLAARGYAVRALMRPAQPHSATTSAPPFAIVSGDLRDSASLNAACEGMDAVVHLAGIADVNNVDPAELRKVNVVGTGNLLDACVQQRVGRFIQLSSSLAKTTPQGDAPATAYGRSKRDAETLVRQAQAEGKLDTAILRPVNVYGVGMRGGIHTLISLIVRRLLPPLPRLDTRLSMVARGDVVRAIELLLDNPAGTGGTWLITDGEEYRITEIEAAVYRVLGRRQPRWRMPRVLPYAAATVAGMVSAITGRKGGINTRTYRNLTTDNVFSDRPIREELGYRSTGNFYRELPEIIEAMAPGQHQDNGTKRP